MDLKSCQSFLLSSPSFRDIQKQSLSKVPHWKKAKKGRTVTKSSNLTRKPLFCKDEKKSGIVAPVFLLLAFSGLTARAQKNTGGRNSGNPRYEERQNFTTNGKGESGEKKFTNLELFHKLFIFVIFFKQRTCHIGSLNYQISPQYNTKLILLHGRANRPISLSPGPGMLGTSPRQRRKGHKMLKCKDCPLPPQLTDFSSPPWCNSTLFDAASSF